MSPGQSRLLALVAGIVLAASAGGLLGPGRDAAPDPLGIPAGAAYRLPVVGLGEPESAIGFYSRRLAHDPSSKLNRALLASAYMEKASLSGEPGWLLVAERMAREAFDPGIAPAMSLSVLAGIAEARHEYASARRLAGEVLRIEPQNTGALAVRASVAAATGAIAQARRDVGALLSGGVTLGTSVLAAQVELAAGDHAAAVRHLIRGLGREQAGELVASMRARILLSRIALARGSVERALALARDARTVLPGHPAAIAAVARAEGAAGATGVAGSRP